MPIVHKAQQFESNELQCTTQSNSRLPSRVTGQKAASAECTITRNFNNNVDRKVPREKSTSKSKTGEIYA